jgi:hypothetical protein
MKIVAGSFESGRWHGVVTPCSRALGTLLHLGKGTPLLGTAWGCFAPTCTLLNARFRSWFDWFFRRSLVRFTVPERRFIVRHARRFPRGSCVERIEPTRLRVASTSFFGPWISYHGAVQGIGHLDRVFRRYLPGYFDVFLDIVELPRRLERPANFPLVLPSSHIGRFGHSQNWQFTSDGVTLSGTIGTIVRHFLHVFSKSGAPGNRTPISCLQDRCLPIGPASHIVMSF